MLQHADHVGFVEEHLPRDLRAIRVLVFFDVVNLDCDVAAVVRIVRQVHHAGAALANLVDDDVFADLVGHVMRALDLANRTGHSVSRQVISHPYKPNKIKAYSAAARSSSIIPRPPPSL